ncbi:fumarylacetoacetate hydrolase family protein [Herbiconiux sp. KACC 21604]|uniref:fumarylacetoacetate hydrolase family protein n=1 Tax=unclassified Herbiconiux TaxID=2618217 RepID=UPI0014931E68|nr:fumarylacetoacetate hydrolase family protein [Herbiconiux sp. SALV-R1]QJU55591.1 fumarylacetoacetate hydrolase family protein [Herbiconiux sp. SALV-R1]WPO86786.1 fumarylacetoacetate hydrolase family protein [Herbiconiux sp. KACC 21604]
MRIARLGEVGAEHPVLVTDEGFLDLAGITPDITGEFLESGGLERVRGAYEAGALPAFDGEGLRVGAPIARPSAVLCIGMNYAAHAAESGSAPPEVPILFFKTPNTVVGPNDVARIPRGSTKTDWEVELAVVIGQRASYLSSPDESLAHVAGFAVANDLSEREWQLEISGGQWGKGKSAPGFTPFGPWLVTPDEVDHRDLRLTSTVNGEARQDSRTSDLIFGVEFIVWQLSQYLTLEPGDVVLTGTPEGVALSGRFPYLKAGDVVELTIEGLGAQRQEFVDA